MNKIVADKNNKETWIKRAREVFDIELISMERTRDSLGADFIAAAEILSATLDRGGRIVISGVGKNLPIAEKISATMASTGSTSIVLNPVQAMHGDLGILSDSDCLIAMSFSGESEEIVRLLPIIKQRNIPIIGIAGKKECSMAASCDVMLAIDTPNETDPFNMAPTASTTATLAIGDALAMVLLDIREFNREKYAKLHPAGAIGKTLLTRVVDIMRIGDALVALSEDATVKDSLVAMTKARAGATYIVDDAGKLLGVFTDGDLRRHLADDSATLTDKLGGVMTKNPINIDVDKMATDVLKLFQAHQIDDIPVVDGDGKLVGSIDISDLPKLKVL